MKYVINVLKFLLFSKFYFPFEILSKKCNRLLVSSIQQHNHFGDERNAVCGKCSVLGILYYKKKYVFVFLGISSTKVEHKKFYSA